MSKKYLVIGGGAIGLNICRKLVEDGYQVDLFSKNIRDSVSYKYTNGITTHVPFTFNNIPVIRTNNYLWIISCAILTYLTNFEKKKKYLYQKSMDILQPYNVKVNNSSNVSEINFQEVFENILNYLQSNERFRYYDKDLDLNDLDLNDLDLLKTKYKNIFVCIGANSPESIYNKNYYGYKIVVNSDIITDESTFEDGFFIKSGDKLTLFGSFVNKETSDQYILNKIKKLNLWKKYKCYSIHSIEKGKRSVSLDFLPFYHNLDNIIFIKGGSTSGASIAPAITYNIVNKILYNKNPDKITLNFNINRFNFIKIFLLIFLIIILYIVKWLLNF